MNVYQVEEYYVTLDPSEIDFGRKDEISDYIEEYGYKHNFDSDCLTIDEFDCPNDAGSFAEELKEAFPV